MTNLEKANKAVLRLSNDDSKYFIKIKPLIKNGKPVIAHTTQSVNGECFIYHTTGKRKIFIEVRISESGIICNNIPRFDIYSGNYDITIDKILENYPHYLSPEELIIKFIIEDLPKLNNHNRDKTLLIVCNTDQGQGNIGYLSMKNDFLKLVTEAGLGINYIIQLQ